MPMPNQPPDRDASLVALGRAVRRLRLEAKLSQQRLAMEVEVDPTYISRIETGRSNISFSAMRRISRALSVPAWRLVQLIEAMEQDQGD
jgi:transcriptional regulator with XRE-family HTH domain